MSATTTEPSCSHPRQIVGVNDCTGEILLRCTGRHCATRSRVAGRALDVRTVTVESRRAWRSHVEVVSDGDG